MTESVEVNRGDNAPASVNTPEGVSPDDAKAAAGFESISTSSLEDEGSPLRDEKTGKFIPLDRHKAVLDNARQRAELAERQLAEAQEKIAVHAKGVDVSAIEKEVEELDKAHAAAVLDGDADKMAELAKQIRAKERQIQLAQTELMTSNAQRQAAEEVRVEMAVQSIEEAYPQLKPGEDNTQYDQDLVDMVLATQAHLHTTQRMAPSEALIEAARRVMSKFNGIAGGAGDPKGLAVGAALKSRQAAQVTKNIVAAKGQPLSTRDIGANGDLGLSKVDVSAMTQEDFAALPPDTLKRLRGDAYA